MNKHKFNLKTIIGSGLLLVLAFLSNTPVIAQGASDTIKTDFSALELALIVLVGLTLMVVILVLMASVSIYRQSVEMLRQKQGVTTQKEDGFANWFWKTFNAAKPERSVLMHHEYDGIHELDNDLPPWWKYGFYLTILLAFGYIYVYANGLAPNSPEEYRIAVKEGEEKKATYLAKMAASINEENVTLADAAGVKKGAQLFEKKCKTCHGDAGQGLSGPNLTDKYWLHGGGIKNVYKTIKYGVTSKGMIAWESQLSPLQMKEVASYVLSLQGSNPPSGKEPQGEVWEEPSE